MYGNLKKIKTGEERIIEQPIYTISADGEMAFYLGLYAITIGCVGDMVMLILKK
ncbi:MAG: hypothetical protein ACLUE2_10185 [Bacteroides cellulosilyticus]